MKKKRDGALRQKISGMIRGRCELHITEHEALCVTNHSGILQTDENEVAFQCPGYRLRICGTGLVIDAAANQCALIKGQIAEIRFLTEERRHD